MDFSDFASRHINARLVPDFPEMPGFTGYHSQFPRSPLHQQFMTSSSRETRRGSNQEDRSSPSRLFYEFQQQQQQQRSSPRSQFTASSGNGNVNQSNYSPRQERGSNSPRDAGKPAETKQRDFVQQTAGVKLSGSENKPATNLDSAKSQSEDELKKHGPEHTLFKVDNPQLEISEEFPNRERIRKLSMKKQKQDKEQQQRKQSEEPIKEELREIPNTPSPPPSVTDKAEEFNGGHPVPDWQANVQTGDNFQKRHLRAVRQGHTLHVIAEKVTENVKTGRSKVTREWRVVAPEVVDAASILAKFDDVEKRLVITGMFDEMRAVQIT
ncbi:uncharacterized protein LOC134844592 isoform X2 [Symsagittifera roscoffensis]